MKFGKRQARPVEVALQSFGKEITLGMRPLSALEVDEIKRKFPPPLAPRKEVDGVWVIDATDDDYRRADTEWRERFLLLQICEQIGPEAFETDDPFGRIRALQESFTEKELVALATQAILVGRGEIRAEDQEAAKQALVPFESAAPEGASTAQA